MSASPFARSEIPTDRRSDAPLAFDTAGDSVGTRLPFGLARMLPQSLVGMSGYLVAGVFLGLVLIVAITVARSDSSATASAGVVTDEVVRLTALDIGEPCWRGAARGSAARVTVSLEVGLDGKVRNAVAAGQSSTMRGCVEAHVKAWQFLPQATSSQMVLPVEIDPR